MYFLYFYSISSTLISDMYTYIVVILIHNNASHEYIFTLNDSMHQKDSCYPIPSSYHPNTYLQSQHQEYP